MAAIEGLPALAGAAQKKHLDISGALQHNRQMAQATTVTDAHAAGAAETRGPARVRAQEILLAAAATALLALLGWLALSMVQVREDIVQLRSAVARNTESIRHIERRLDSMDSRLDSMDARLAAMQSSLAVLVERSGGEAAPRR